MSFRRLTVENILDKTLFLGIVLSPFNGLPIAKSLGLFQSAYFYFSTIGIIVLALIFILQKEEIKINVDAVMKLLLIFFAYALFSGIVNMQTIINAEFKGRYGEVRFLSIYFTFIYIALLFIYSNHIIHKKENLFTWMNRAILYSFYIAGGYAFFQVLSMFEFDIGNMVIEHIAPWISFAERREGFLIKTWRVQSVCLEPSMFGVYMAAVFPWVLGNGFVIGKGTFKKLMGLYAMIIIVLSFSRTAYFITLLQVLMFICFFYRGILKEIFTAKKLMFIFCIAISVFGIYFTQFMELIPILNVFLSFTNDGNSTTSNLTRFGLQLAGINMFQTYPIFGVGLGQFQFHVSEYLPDWSYQSIEILGVVNSGDPNFFYGSFNTHIRVLAEMGIVGFAIWISIAGVTLFNLFKYIKIVQGEEKDFLKIITISFVGIFVSFANFDTYLLFHYWFFVALVCAFPNKFMWNGNERQKGCRKW